MAKSLHSSVCMLLTSIACNITVAFKVICFCHVAGILTKRQARSIKVSKPALVLLTIKKVYTTVHMKILYTQQQKKCENLLLLN